VSFEFVLERPLARGAATLGIYDLTGRLVARRSVPSTIKGRNTVSWDGRGENGKRPASGVYLARLEADGQSASRRLVVIR
jgi:flagellar hook assembly protein FlgD